MARRPCPESVLARVLVDDESCLAVFFHWRWPKGFACPRCGHRDGVRIARRPAFRCKGCNHHARVFAGTVLHRTHLPPRTILSTIVRMGSRKTSVSALQLHKDLGIAYQSALSLLRRIRGVLVEKTLLHGVAELAWLELAPTDLRMIPKPDDARRMLLVAVERRREMCRPKERPPFHVGKIRARIGDLFDIDALKHDVMKRPAWGGRLLSPLTQTVLHNALAWIRGTFHGVSRKHVDGYLREFVFRFNRRRREDLLPAFIGKRVLALCGA